MIVFWGHSVCIYHRLRVIVTSLSQFVAVVFQIRLTEECNDLLVTVSQLKCKLDSCQRKLEDTEYQLKEREREAIDYGNELQVLTFDAVIYIYIVSSHSSITSKVGVRSPGPHLFPGPMFQ